jgi:hypothetical protein
MWSARRHLSARWADARAGDRGARADFATLAMGNLAMGWVLCQLGLPFWAAGLALWIVWMLALLVSRLRAELGLPVHNLQFQGPDGPMIAVFGEPPLGTGGLEAFGALYALERSLQGHPMPHEMEAAYMADSVQGAGSRFWWAIGVVGVLTAIAGPWILLRMVSGMGLELGPGGYNPIGEEGWRRLGQFVGRPPDVDGVTVFQMLGGAALTFAMIAARRTWLGFPFHPVGYAICGSWGTGMVWTPVFLAWILKSLVLRYGGLPLYRASIPLALGVVMGEFTAGAAWTIISLLTGVQTYRIWLF